MRTKKPASDGLAGGGGVASKGGDAIQGKNPHVGKNPRESCPLSGKNSTQRNRSDDQKGECNLELRRNTALTMLDIRAAQDRGKAGRYTCSAGKNAQSD